MMPHMLIASSLFALVVLGSSSSAQAIDTTGLKATSSRTPLGNPSASVTVTEYGDLQCPACKSANDLLNKPLLAKYRTKIRFDFKHFPLQSIHEYSFDAAQASECAADQGKFWEFLDTVYAHQQDLNSDALREWAKSLGLDTSLFNRCLDSGIKAKTVTADAEEAEKMGIDSIPSYFVNGQKVMNTEQALATAIDAAMRQQSGPQKTVSGKSLPKSYRGDYTWRYGGTAQRVNLYIRSVGKASGSADITFSGWETYGADAKTRVIVQGKINPATRHVTMFEKNTRSGSNTNFVSDGSFEGEISNDLSQITLVWTTKSTGEKGDIVFRATGRR